MLVNLFISKPICFFATDKGRFTHILSAKNGGLQHLKKISMGGSKNMKEKEEMKLKFGLKYVINNKRHYFPNPIPPYRLLT